MKRGDVVIIEFPFAEGGNSKFRPALIVQHDRDNQRMSNTIVAMISGNIRFAGEPSQVLIDPATPDGATTGLHGPSVVKCNNLFTVRQNDVKRTIGQLSSTLLQQVDDALRSALNL